MERDTTIAWLQRSVSDAQRERDEALDRSDDETKSGVSLKIEPQRLDDTSEQQPRKLRAPEDEVRSVSGEKDMAESRVTETEGIQKRFRRPFRSCRHDRRDTAHGSGECASVDNTREGSGCSKDSRSLCTRRGGCPLRCTRRPKRLHCLGG